MKQTTILLSALLLTISLSACHTAPAEAEPPAENIPTQSTEQAAPSTTTTTQPPAAQPIYLRDKYEAEIESAYDADAELPEYQSTAGMCGLSDKYAQRWRDIADEYYDKLMAYEHEEDYNTSFCTVEEYRTALADMKAAHEDHVEKEMTAYSTVLRYEYQGGSLSGVIAAGHRYNLEKEWALKILDMCDMLGIE